MYVRFNAVWDNGEERIFGIFWIAQYMYQHELLVPPKGVEHYDYDDDDIVWRNLDWFAKHLTVPIKQRRSRNEQAARKAISYFKDTAAEHIAKLREIAQILERYGVVTEFMKTDKPGYILFEDEFQVFAEPFKD